MSVKILISFDKIQKDVSNKIKSGINETLDYLKEYAKTESPIKSGEYNNNHKIDRADDYGKSIVGTLKNETKYAGILEYGVMGRTYNYHRYGTTYMRGIGARVYTRTQDNNLKKIVEIIAKHLSRK